MCEQVYKAEQPARSLRVYHLFYEDSQESDKFTAAISREVNVFQDLIRQKEFMVLPDPIQALDQVQAYLIASAQHAAAHQDLDIFCEAILLSCNPDAWCTESAPAILIKWGSL